MVHEKLDPIRESIWSGQSHKVNTLNGRTRASPLPQWLVCSSDSPGEVVGKSGCIQTPPRGSISGPQVPGDSLTPSSSALTAPVSSLPLLEGERHRGDKCRQPESDWVQILSSSQAVLCPWPKAAVTLCWPPRLQAPRSLAFPTNPEAGGFQELRRPRRVPMATNTKDWGCLSPCPSNHLLSAQAHLSPSGW